MCLRILITTFTLYQNITDFNILLRHAIYNFFYVNYNYFDYKNIPNDQNQDNRNINNFI